MLGITNVSTLVELRHAFDHAATAARWQVDGLTDAEYFWEPVTPCWSVRRRSETDWPHVWGRGTYVVEDVGPGGADVMPRVTTISWRLVHLAGWLDVYRTWIAGTPDRLPLDELEIPGDADGAVAWLARAQHAFGAQIDQLRPDDLEYVVTTFYGEHRSIENLVRGMTLEQLHHSAEIGCLRDIHRGHARSEWWPEDIPLREA
jgi:hypothetical protein